MLPSTRTHACSVEPSTPSLSPGNDSRSINSGSSVSQIHNCATESPAIALSSHVLSTSSGRGSPCAGASPPALTFSALGPVPGTLKDAADLEDTAVLSAVAPGTMAVARNPNSDEVADLGDTAMLLLSTGGPVAEGETAIAVSPSATPIAAAAATFAAASSSCDTDKLLDDSSEEFVGLSGDNANPLATHANSSSHPKFSSQGSYRLSTHGGFDNTPNAPPQSARDSVSFQDATFGSLHSPPETRDAILHTSPVKPHEAVAQAHALPVQRAQVAGTLPPAQSAAKAQQRATRQCAVPTNTEFGGQRDHPPGRELRALLQERATADALLGAVRLLLPQTVSGILAQCPRLFHCFALQCS
jgi:hypothetical protein